MKWFNDNNQSVSISRIYYKHDDFIFINVYNIKINWYYRNFSGDSLGQVEAVDVGDVAKWRQKLI